MKCRYRGPGLNILLLGSLSGLLFSCGLFPQHNEGWEEPKAGLFATGPYIVVGDNQEAHIAFSAELQEAPIATWWRKGADADAFKQSVRARKVGDLWVAMLSDLPRGPELSYQIQSTLGTTPVYDFRIGVPPKQPFRFAAFGDTRTGHEVHRSVVEAVARERVAFVVHTGDMVERGGKREQWRRFFQIERPLLVDTPIVPAVGNHDIGSRHYFRHYFLHRLWAQNRRYFARDWGNVRVVIMDGGIECRDGCQQYAVVRRLLAEGSKQGKFLVMMLHYPPYSSGTHGSHLGVQKPIRQLSRRYGVELVIAGHDHHYERSKPVDGTTYIVSGSAGAPIRPVDPEPFSAVVRTEPHYVLVDVETDRLILRAVNLRGDTFDTTVIGPVPPQEI